MKVWVDAYRCRGYGNCIASAPGLLEWDEDLDQAYAIDEEVAAPLENDARAAARACPARAVVVGE